MGGLKLSWESGRGFFVERGCSCVEIRGGGWVEWIGDFAEVFGDCAELGGEGVGNDVGVGEEGVDVAGEDFTVWSGYLAAELCCGYVDERVQFCWEIGCFGG